MSPQFILEFFKQDLLHENLESLAEKCRQVREEENSLIDKSLSYLVILKTLQQDRRLMFELEEELPKIVPSLCIPDSVLALVEDYAIKIGIIEFQNENKFTRDKQPLSVEEFKESYNSAWEEFIDFQKRKAKKNENNHTFLLDDPMYPEADPNLINQHLFYKGKYAQENIQILEPTFQALTVVTSALERKGKYTDICRSLGVLLEFLSEVLYFFHDIVDTVNVAHGLSRDNPSFAQIAADQNIARKNDSQIEVSKYEEIFRFVLGAYDLEDYIARDNP